LSITIVPEKISLILISVNDRYPEKDINSWGRDRGLGYNFFWS